LPDLERASPLLLSVGRLETYKGFGDVLSALERLHERGALAPSWRWVLVGEGPLAKPLSRRAARLAPHVRLLGRAGEELLHALYARADIFVHATRYEGSSLVTLEAMAHGLPVVATRAGGIPDKVLDGETGRLVEPGDVDALANAVAELARDGERARALGRRGRERALALFSWPALAARTLELYEELLRERR
jgi:glycosyltransferase involved in cell wall biosynthesis